MRNLLFLFNHAPTHRQLEDARRELGVTHFIQPPETVKRLWQQVPPKLESLSAYLDPVRRWIKETGAPGDYVLIQGDFGATHLMVYYTKTLGMVPVYSTTLRMAVENPDSNGGVQLSHTFKHQRFRRYGE